MNTMLYLRREKAGIFNFMEFFNFGKNYRFPQSKNSMTWWDFKEHDFGIAQDP